MLIHSYIDLPDFHHIEGTESRTSILYDNSHINTRLQKTLPSQQGIEMGIISYVRTIADQKYTDYVLSLIPELKDKIAEIGFQVAANYTNHPNGGQFLPHVDGKRGKFCIHWNFSTGGDDTTTYWWQEGNQPLIREPGTRIANYHQFTEVDKIIWQVERWGIFRTDILHGINPIKTERSAFTIGFNEEELFHYIVEKYGVK